MCVKSTEETFVLSTADGRNDPPSCTADISSHVNERYLNTPEKKAKIAKLHTKARTTQQEALKLRQKIQEITDKNGEAVDTCLHSDLLTIMKENGERSGIKEAYSEGSFSRLFWEKQFKAASVADARQMRRHPVIIKWCLNLKLLSGAAYHAVRSSGFIKLHKLFRK